MLNPDMFTMIPRWAKSSFHCVLALPIQALLYAMTDSWDASIVGVFLFFYSREMAQYQYRIKGDGSTATVWNKGWSPLEWDKWSRIDAAAPILSSIVISILWRVYV